ncbi:retention module-containing protein, partial [Marinobacterium sp. D7]|uniref:retention module-containing protein n=1 Tax=Marinobacterium ramblicola TaxID=2849041 RepID=UPI001C2DE691
MSEVIGNVSFLNGVAVAVSADGTERVLMVGDVIYADEVIRTGPDARIEIAMDAGSPVVLTGGQSWLASADTYTTADQFDISEAVTDGGSFSDVDAIQAAILAGQDPTAVGEATAAGAAGAGTGGAGGNEGADFVSLDRTANEVDPTAGYDTTGITFAVEQPVSEEATLELPSGVITLGDLIVEEGSGTASISATIDVAVTDSPLVITLSNGATITIPVGATSGESTPFEIQGDDPYLDGDAFDVSISGTSGGAFSSIDTTDTATVTVNDTVDTTTITLGDVSVDEGSEGATITATVNNPVTGSPLVITLDNGATITIPVGESSGESTPFEIQGDDVYVDGESYTVAISSTDGGNYEALDSSDTATVEINDTIDTVTVKVFAVVGEELLDASDVAEGATATYVAHAVDPDGNIIDGAEGTVDISFTHGTAG